MDGVESIPSHLAWFPVVQGENRFSLRRNFHLGHLDGHLYLTYLNQRQLEFFNKVEGLVS